MSPYEEILGSLERPDFCQINPLYMRKNHTFLMELYLDMFPDCGNLGLGKSNKPFCWVPSFHRPQKNHQKCKMGLPGVLFTKHEISGQYVTNPKSNFKIVLPSLIKNSNSLKSSPNQMEQIALES